MDDSMRRFFLLFPLSALLLLSGCESAHTPIKGSDYTANAPILRASFPIGKEPERWRKRIQASVTHQEGRFHDSIESGKTAAMDETEFAGPTNLEGEAKFTSGHLGVVFPIPTGDWVRWEPWAGGGIVNGRVTVSDATTSAEQDEEYYGPSGGIAFILTSADKHFGLRAGLDYTWAGIVEFTEQEFAVFYAPTPNVEFLMGYRQFDYRRVDNIDSDLLITIAGPAAGINVRF